MTNLSIRSINGEIFIYQSIAPMKNYHFQIGSVIYFTYVCPHKKLNMKTTISIITVFSMIVLLAGGCTKKEKDPSTTQPSTPTYTYQLSATINGSPYSQSGCYYTEKYSFLAINRDSDALQRFPRVSVQVINMFDTGTYDLNSAGAFGRIDSSAQIDIVDAYGTLHVATRNDSVVIGTFSFTCVDSTKVTNGSFTAKRIY